MADAHDVRVLRDLATRYADVCHDDEQDRRRDLWRRSNSLEKVRPPVLMRGGAFAGELPELSDLQCEDPFYRGHEQGLRRMLFLATLGDDAVFEPWITQNATVRTPPEGLWGVRIGRIPSPEKRGSWMFDPPLKRLEDIGNLVAPHHDVDEEATARNVSRLHDAVGDVLDVAVDRAPAYRVWNADLSTNIAYLRGLEQVMWDMVDNPEWLHRLLAFLRDGVLTTHEEAERAGDWRLCAHQNQAMPYARELPDPAADGGAAPRSKLWVFVSAQELTGVSPAMHDEFMLQYQLPIMEPFGLVAYGCCEDLTEKIDMLRQIPNLRRIAVAPRADLRRSAEQIGSDYVMSWRPNPAEMVRCGFDADRVRKTTTEAMEICKGLHVDITLKDVHTIEGDADRLRHWCRITKDVAEAYA